MASTDDQRPVVSGWAALSPYGIEPHAFRDGLLAGRSTVRELPGELRGSSPPEAGGWVDFEIAALLGRKGTRSMDRLTALAVRTAGMVLDTAGPGLAADHPEAMGLVLGSGHGSVKSIMDLTRESLTADRPYLVDAGVIPNAAMNAAAGRSAIWHTLKGPNVTVSGGALTGLLGLAYGVRLLRRQRAEAVLVGCAEEYSAQRAWLEHHSRAAGDREAVDRPLGEGCAMVLLEPAARAQAHGRTVLAEVLGTRFMAFQEPRECGPAVARAVTELLKEADVSTDRISLLLPSDCGGPLGESEDAGVRAVFDGHRPAEVRMRGLIGDLSAATGAFQLVAALAHGGPGLALATSVDGDGTVGCALLSLPEVRR